MCVYDVCMYVCMYASDQVIDQSVSFFVYLLIRVWISVKPIAGGGD